VCSILTNRTKFLTLEDTALRGYEMNQRRQYTRNSKLLQGTEL